MTFEYFQPNHLMVKIIGEIDEFKGSWRSISRISPERLASLKKVATIESIGSSTRIEGVSLSNKEVEDLLQGLKTTSFGSRDEEEVVGYADLMKTIFENYASIPFSENYIKQLHSVLLQHSSKDDSHRGKYKTIPNNVEAFDENGNSIGTIFKTSSPFETPFKMTALVDWTENTLLEKQIHPLFIIGAFVVSFLAIHPFRDGNGRLSRALTTLLLLQQGYAYVPYSSLESVIEANKETYYLALRQTQTTMDTTEPNWNAWLQFFLNSMKKQTVNLDARVKRLNIIEGALPALSVQILELARELGSVKISELEKLLGESRGTISLRLKELVSSGHLERHGKGPATWYSLPGNPTKPLSIF